MKIVAFNVENVLCGMNSYLFYLRLNEMYNTSNEWKTLARAATSKTIKTFIKDLHYQYCPQEPLCKYAF